MKTKENQLQAMKAMKSIEIQRELMQNYENNKNYETQ